MSQPIYALFCPAPDRPADFHLRPAPQIFILALPRWKKLRPAHPCPLFLYILVRLPNNPHLVVTFKSVSEPDDLSLSQNRLELQSTRPSKVQDSLYTHINPPPPSLFSPKAISSSYQHPLPPAWLPLISKFGSSEVKEIEDRCYSFISSLQKLE